MLTRRKVVWTAVIAFAAVTLLLWLVSVTVATEYTVVSPPRGGQLMEGDRVVVSRLSYGLRLPWPGLQFSRRLSYRRPERGGIMAFNLPSDSLHTLLSRPVVFGTCLALPGDTVYVSRTGLLRRTPSRGFFPFAIPARDVPVRVTPWNASLLCSALNLHEPCHTAALKGDTLMVDGHSAEFIAFTQDYFWAYSGAQSDKFDSRFFGLLPESHIIGRVVGIFFSLRPHAPLRSRLRAGRMFKAI